MTENKSKEFCDLCVKSAECLTLKNFVLSSPKDGEVLKIKGTLKQFSSKNLVQLEYFCTEGRVRQENEQIDSLFEKLYELCETFSRCDLNDSGASASLMRSKKGKVTLVKHGSVGAGAVVAPKGDKVKNWQCLWSSFIPFTSSSNENLETSW